jgi:hypothetical protein
VLLLDEPAAGVPRHESAEPKYEWLRQRGHPDAPDKWEGKDFEQYLVNDINLRIAAKCMNSYGPNCLLAVYVFPNSPSLMKWKHSLKASAFPRLIVLMAFIFAVNFRRHSTYTSAACWKMRDHRQNEEYGNSTQLTSHPRMSRGMV